MTSRCASVTLSEIVQRACRRAVGGGDRGRDGNARARRLLDEYRNAAHRLFGIRAQGAGVLGRDAVDVVLRGVRAGE